MRRDFIANVSHELKTPLTVITGFLETLQDLELEPRQRTRYLQLMTEQAKSMQRLVDDLLTLSALESEQNALRRQRVRRRPAAARALGRRQGAVRPPAQGRRSTSASRRSVTGSRDELASAFGNLVSNAVRYTPDGGHDHARLARRRRGPRRVQRHRHRHRHRPRAHSAADRALLPRRSQPVARDGRHGSRPRDRQARAAAAPGRARRDERARARAARSPCCLPAQRVERVADRAIPRAVASRRTRVSPRYQ